MASEIPWVQPVTVRYYLLISTLFGGLQLKWIHTYDFNYDYYDVIGNMICMIIDELRI